jgi:hypothetical protein
LGGDSKLKIYVVSHWVCGNTHNGHGYTVAGYFKTRSAAESAMSQLAAKGYLEDDPGVEEVYVEDDV